MEAKLQEVKQNLRRRMPEAVEVTGRWLGQVLNGYYQYHAIPGNMAALKHFGSGSNNTGGVVYAAGVSGEGFPNRGWRDCSRAGCPTHGSCILVPVSALTPNIQGRSRMR